MNMNGRIVTGMRYGNQWGRELLQERGKKSGKKTTTQKCRRMLEVKHNTQCFLLRQKTPPETNNTNNSVIRISN
jgi:hypothetical protein